MMFPVSNNWIHISSYPSK